MNYQAVTAVLLPYSLETKCYATMVKYEECEPIDNNEMKTIQEIEDKIE